MSTKTLRRLVLLPALLVLPGSWWIARHGSGTFPLAKWLGVGCIALGLIYWILPRGQVPSWRIAASSLAAVLLGLVALGVLQIPVGIVLSLFGIASALHYLALKRPTPTAHP
jgi:hypothetical protein